MDMEIRSGKAMIYMYIADFMYERLTAEETKNKVVGVINRFNSPIHKKQLAKYAEDVAWEKNILFPKENLI